MTETGGVPPPEASDIHVRKLRGQFLFLAGYVTRSACGQYYFVEKGVRQAILAGTSAHAPDWPQGLVQAPPPPSHLSLAPMLEGLREARGTDDPTPTPTQVDCFTCSTEFCISSCFDSIRRHPGSRPCKHLYAARCAAACPTAEQIRELKLDFAAAIQRRERLVPHAWRSPLLYGDGTPACITEAHADAVITYLKTGGVSRSPQSCEPNLEFPAAPPPTPPPDPLLSPPHAPAQHPGLPPQAQDMGAAPHGGGGGVEVMHGGGRRQQMPATGASGVAALSSSSTGMSPSFSATDVLPSDIIGQPVVFRPPGSGAKGPYHSGVVTETAGPDTLLLKSDQDERCILSVPAHEVCTPLFMGAPHAGAKVRKSFEGLQFCGIVTAYTPCDGSTANLPLWLIEYEDGDSEE